MQSLRRSLCGNEFYPFYTNVDKVHRYVTADNAGAEFGKNSDDDDSLYTAPLTFKIEEAIYNKFKLKDNFILKKEIEIVKKNFDLKGIIFLTGPNYERSIRYALGTYDKGVLQVKPSHKKSKPVISDICVEVDEKSKEFLGLPNETPTFWTYHPNYLSNSGLRKNDWSGITDKILNEIKQK